MFLLFACLFISAIGMTLSCQEEHPLLHEDISDVEHFRPRRGHMVLSRAIRSRARNKVNGAASIFKLWPGFWSSVLTYWWIALGMIAFITLLIYNGINVMALIPPERSGLPINMRINESVKKTNALPDVFMHVHFKIHEEIDLNMYIPFIEILTEEYKNYIYHLVIVIDDVESTINDQRVNEFKNLDKHSLLHHINSNDIIRNINGLVVEHISLTEYLDMSPLKKHWRHIPFDIIKFLVRAVSIWEKGGIAFNPLILTPSTPHPIYINKLYDILDNFIEDSDLKKEDNYLTINSDKDDVKPKRVNNIRDIIDAMELNTFDRNDIDKEEELLSLETAESRFLNPMIVDLLSDTKKVIHKISSSFLPKKISNYLNDTKIKQFTRYEHETNNTRDKNIIRENKITETNTTANESTLPVIMRYLLMENETKQNTMPRNITRKRKAILNKNNIDLDNTEHKSMIQIFNDTYENYKPMIVPANITELTKMRVAKNEIYVNEDKHDYKNQEQLTVDLNGNILATKTSCHAFIGTLFTNAVHHNHSGNITEFIIHELSIFCKGLFSSCNGIDVILI